MKPLVGAGRAALSAALVLAGCLLLGNSGRISRSLIFLPGTQPGTVDTVGAGGAAACSGCHATSGGRVVPIYGDWAGTMMAQSARDPVFYAALAVANKYSAMTGDNTGEFCIRCHSPTGWLAARSEDVTGASLRGSDLDGVQCDYCHRIVDPLHPDSTVLPTVFPVPGYGNGMHLVQTSDSIRRGPRDGSAAAHPAAQDTFQASASLCAICHDVSNPFHAAGQDRIFLPPHAYAPLERTYSEWLMSAFPSEGPGGTCQGCHMGRTAGYAASTPSSPERTDVSAHDMTGGNTFVPRILGGIWNGIDTSLTGRAADRAAATLRRSAVLGGGAVRDSAGVRAGIRITNLTGHKLPTGYPEGRRMWLTVTATDAAGDTVYRSGVYDTAAAALIPDPAARVYEAVHGLTEATAALYGLPPGPSFFFSLNDTVLYDNRIPPRGFTNAGFDGRLAGPVGASYADGEYWDDAGYHLPASSVRVSAALWYQSISREYVTFLRDETAGDPFDWNGWGEKLFAAWDLNGRSAPVLVDSLSFPVTDSVTAAGENGAPLPAACRLDPPYPNPFNAAVWVRFAVPGTETVTIDLVDLSGTRVAFLATGDCAPGDHTLSFSAASLPSGVYFVRMRAGRFFDSRKILLIR
jgi:hypothetical protein